jgi:hypothetical protein
MRYIAIDDSLTLLAASGKIKYQFKNGVLQIGTPTGTGAGNEIVPDLAGTDLDSKMQTLYPAGATDLAKVGLDEIFFQAPPIVAAGTLASGSYYTLLSGTADLTGANYTGKYTLVLPSQVPSLDLADFPLGFVIKATAAITVPAGDATWALSLTPRYLDDQEHNLRSEAFIMNELTTFKDESSWNGKTYSARTKDPKYVR